MDGPKNTIVFIRGRVFAVGVGISNTVIGRILPCLNLMRHLEPLEIFLLDEELQQSVYFGSPSICCNTRCPKLARPLCMK
jgi:type IV secretory pathway protease TraF